MSGLDDHAQGSRWLVAGTVAAALLAGPGTAAACWDGYAGQGRRTLICVMEGPTGTIHRVWVGAYLTRAEAAEAGATLRAATGVQGFVRPL